MYMTILIPAWNWNDSNVRYMKDIVRNSRMTVEMTLSLLDTSDESFEMR